MNKHQRMVLALSCTLFMVSSCSIAISLKSAAPAVEWSRTFGGVNDEIGFSVQQTSDGGYIITGDTMSYGTGGIWLIKTDSKGNEEWNRTFGVNPLLDRGASVQQTSDGGYIIIGHTYLADYDFCLIKTDMEGKEEWNRTFGDIYQDLGRAGQQTKDGGYVITGSIQPYSRAWFSVCLIKTDPEGREEWCRTFGGASSEEGKSVQQTTDGGFIITGYTVSHGAGSSDVWLIKTDPEGKEEWSRTFGGASSEEGESVQQTTDGGFIILGKTESYGAGSSDVWLIKTDPEGKEEWNRTFGGARGDAGESVQQTIDGSYVIAGYTGSYGAGHRDVWLIKTDPEGKEEWSRTFGGVYEDRSYSVQQTKDGSYVITGYTRSYGAGGRDVWLIKVQEFSTTATSTEEEKGVPGFAVSFTIAGLLAVVYLLRRRR